MIALRLWYCSGHFFFSGQTCRPRSLFDLFSPLFALSPSTDNLIRPHCLCTTPCAQLHFTIPPDSTHDTIPMIPNSFLHSEIRLRLLLLFSSPRHGAVYIFFSLYFRPRVWAHFFLAWLFSYVFSVICSCGISPSLVPLDLLHFGLESHAKTGELRKP